MKLSIIIPCFNEENTIEEIIKKVAKVKLPKGVSKEIIMVDDGSTDNTLLNLNSAKRIGRVRIIKHKTNMGKGMAVRTGIKDSKGEIILIQDADLEYNPDYIPRLIEPIIRGKSDVVYGTRFKNYPLRLTGKKRTPLATHYLGNMFLSFITRILYGSAVTDMETGYKVFRKNILGSVRLRSRRFDFEAEITAKILKLGYNIYEIQIKTVPRGYNEGKKITWRDGFIALWILIKYKFTD